VHNFFQAITMFRNEKWQILTKQAKATKADLETGVKILHDLFEEIFGRRENHKRVERRYSYQAVKEKLKDCSS
jgi:hypothetical protein